MVCLGCLFTWQNFINFLFFIGIQHFIIYLYENLKSPFKILKSILTEYFQPQSKRTLVEKYGKWAVVTGSTDGIGKAYAKELARHGLNIVLISRSKDKLIQVSEEIESQFKVETKWIVADFSKKNIYKNIEDHLEGIPVGILVNNVGTMYDYPEEFANMEEDKIWDMMIINVGACTMMTRMLVNQMKDNRRGAIVNVSSFFNVCFGPYSAVYAASKIYVKYLSKALEWELEPYNITVQLLSPGAIPTNLCKHSEYISNNGFLTTHVDDFARQAVFTLGKTNDSTGSWKHSIQMAVSNLFPIELNAWLSMKIMNKMYNR